MASGNVSLVLRWFEEVWNRRRTGTIDELLTDESVSYSESGPLRGKQEFQERAHAVFLSAFPDLKITVEGTVAEGDQVVVRSPFQPKTIQKAPSSSTTAVPPMHKPIR